MEEPKEEKLLTRFIKSIGNQYDVAGALHEAFKEDGRPERAQEFHKKATELSQVAITHAIKELDIQIKSAGE